MAQPWIAISRWPQNSSAGLAANFSRSFQIARSQSGAPTMWSGNYRSSCSESRPFSAAETLSACSSGSASDVVVPCPRSTGLGGVSACDADASRPPTLLTNSRRTTLYAKDEDVLECCQMAFSQDVHAEQYVKAGWDEFQQRNFQRALASTKHAYDRSSLGSYSMFRNRNVESNRIGRGCLSTVDAHDLLPTNWLDSEGIDDLLRNTRDRCSRVQQGRERSSDPVSTRSTSTASIPAP